MEYAPFDFYLEGKKMLINLDYKSKQIMIFRLDQTIY